MGGKTPSKIKIEASELQAKYAALEMEIRLLRDLRSQVASMLKKQMQSSARALKKQASAGKRTYRRFVTKAR